ncbi:MAG: adenylosuccinate lyase [Chromatiales bacterium]|nr:adenylosuccinate lyase [Chromatiales bacterium]
MTLSEITAISPIDGRYRSKSEELAEFFSEYALMRYRLIAEIEWFKFLSAHNKIDEIPALSEQAKTYLDNIVDNFDEQQAMQVKTIEKTTQHDVKALEYYLVSQTKPMPELSCLSNFFHFACTSEDINSTAYGMMLKAAREKCLLPHLRRIRDSLKAMATRYADVAMLARTHGQPASPTTLGKEMANFCYRLHEQTEKFAAIGLRAKANGACGNYNAHHLAYPEIDWQQLSKHYLELLGLQQHPYSTQIEPHDHIAELMDALSRIAHVLLDLCRDIWLYISLELFKQKIAKQEVGSSTMPHKVNPIHFENAEGNLGLAITLARHLSDKLPVSRWQRDLSDSTVLRSVGSVFAYMLIALHSIATGLDRLELNQEQIAEQLSTHPEVLGEAIQTLLRKHGMQDAYEQLKQLQRGQSISLKTLRLFIANTDLPEDDKNLLLALEPKNYIGIASRLAKEV